MEKKTEGFTLIELVVVVLIMGVLASMSMPYYYKTVETSKATDSVALGHMLGNAYRMFRLDHGANSLSGRLNSTSSCNTGTCNPAAGDACTLVRCGYVAPQDWDASSYDYFVGPGSCGGGQASCTRRKSGASGEYAKWGYNFSDTGACSTVSGTTTPDCPKF